MKQIYRATSQNGRHGVAVVSNTLFQGDGEYWRTHRPVQASVVRIGTTEGHEVFRLDPHRPPAMGGPPRRRRAHGGRVRHDFPGRAFIHSEPRACHPGLRARRLSLFRGAVGVSWERNRLLHTVCPVGAGTGWMRRATGSRETTGTF